MDVQPFDMDDYISCCIRAKEFADKYQGECEEIRPGDLAVLRWGEKYEVMIENQEGNVELSPNKFSEETFFAILSLLPCDAREMLTETDSPHAEVLRRAIIRFNKENPDDPIQIFQLGEDD
jgi:hypothetical protein